MKSALLPKGRAIYFNEEHHRYTDDMDNLYTSMTTVIGKYKYVEDFEGIAAACERIGKNPRHPKYLKYKGLRKHQILKKWDKAADDGCEKGNVKHNYLEDVVKRSTGYKRNAQGFVNDRIYTIDDIIRQHKYGLLDLDFFVRTGINTKYPKIYAILVKFTELGFRIYAEIGVYDGELIISGLIDILLVKGDTFVILDWKTNKDEIRFESGYFEKDLNDNPTTTFVAKNTYFKFPLDHLPFSTGNIYTLQLSGYAYLVETFGYKCKGIILCHIRDLQLEDSVIYEHVDVLKIPYLKSDVKRMMVHHAKDRKLKGQKRIML